MTLSCQLYQHLKHGLIPAHGRFYLHAFCYLLACDSSPKLLYEKIQCHRIMFFGARNLESVVVSGFFKYRHISKELIHKIISFNKILMFSSRPAVVLQNENEEKNITSKNP